MSKLQIVGRSSSHFTRLPRIFAEELRVPYELVPVYDMTALGADVFADNPALKLPVLRVDGRVLFGALNICRAITERAEPARRVVWPEALPDDLSRNAQELVWHGMATQVQIVMGTAVNKLPADNTYFAKARASLEASLIWLDVNLTAALGLLPPRDLSVFEASLHCLVEHLAFRPTVAVEDCAALQAFSDAFAERPSARRTVYSFDPPPT